MSRKTADLGETSATLEIRETPPKFPAPSIGRVVHYRLTEADAAAIDGALGRRNALKAGHVYPAVMTEVHGADCVDLRIFAGPVDRFHSSVMRGDVEGTWFWPPRVV